jgi:hypothetical protein
MIKKIESTGRIDGRLGVPNDSTSLKSVSPSFLCLIIFSPTWKRSHESCIIYLLTTIYYPSLHTLHKIMDINHDGMGPFTPTSSYSSSSIALKFSCANHLRACVDSQLFLSDPNLVT